MKSAILVPNVSDQQIIDSCHNYCDTVITYTKEDILQDDFLPKNRIHYYLLLKENEEIKFCESFAQNNKVFVTDGNWLIKQKRIFTLNKLSSDDGSTLIIQSKSKLHGPFINNENLKNLYLQKKYEDFALETEKYIFDNFDKSYPFLRYYLSMVYFFKLNNPNKSQVHLSLLLNEFKYLAEGWCLLGDILVTSKKHFDAIKAYENAIVYGKNRNIYDGNPVWITKYGSYPQSMLNKIQNLINNTKIISVDKF